MNKRGSKAVWITVIVIIILAVAGVGYFFLLKPDYSEIYAQKIASGEIKNPAEGLTVEEAVAKFDESFVLYLLINIKAYNLKNPPFSSDTPKIEFLIDKDAYNAEVVKGNINAEKGSIDGEDIVIKTTKEEAVKMVKDKAYITTSFRNGSSGIELVAGKATLFTKGYLDIYTELTGKTLTGSFLG